MIDLIKNLYIAELKKHIRLSLEYKRSRGEYTGLAPIGYKNIQNQKNKSDVIVDTERAPIIVKLFNAYATGEYTIKQLTKLAHSLGLVNRQGKFISEGCISNMLQNPFYYGEFRIMDKIYPHIYPKLIDKSLFDTVQTIMKSQKGNK